MRLPIILIVLLILGTTAGRADRATLDNTKTQIALPLAQPPVIDGVFNAAEWARASTWRVTADPSASDGIRGGATGDGSVNPPVDNNDLSFQVYAAYDNDNLYIAVRVTDDSIQSDSATEGSANATTWLDDSVEVFVDGDNSNFATRDTTGTNKEVVGTGGQFVITANNAYRDAEAGRPGYGASAAWFAKTSLTATGYDAEFRISLRTLGNPKPGDIIGFTVAVNDDDDGGNGDRQVIWVGAPHTEATYGNLVIGGKSYAAPKTSAPTIDGTIKPGEYAGATEIKVSPFTGVYDLGSGDDAAEVTDHGYSAWVIHDAEAVYVAVDVTDDMVVNDTAPAGSEDMTTWEDDSVEIFFDANHSHDAGRGTGRFEGQYVFTANGAWRDNEANNPTFGKDNDWFAATSKTSKGYQVEFKVKKSALFNPQDGAVMGFQIALNDDDGNGRKAQLGWSGRAHSEFTYGHLTLLAPVGGKLSISGVKVNGNNLEISFTTPSPSGTRVVQQASNIAVPQWTDVGNVTFSTGTGGATVAAFPKPSSSPGFYRVVIR